MRPEAIALAARPAGLADLPNRFSGDVESLLFNGANSRVLVSARPRRAGRGRACRRPGASPT